MRLDVFSKRNKVLPDVFVYELPPKVRAQIVHILENAIGPYFNAGTQDVWASIAKMIAAEHGLLHLPETPGGRHSRYDGPDFYTDCLNYVLQADSELALDLVELAF